MKKTLLFVYLLSLCNLMLFAQDRGVPKAVHHVEKSAIHVPPQAPPASLKKIYSNLGSSQTDLYNDTMGWEISGPQHNPPLFFGLPFTPKSNSHVSQVQVAVQHVNGANQVNLSLYGDSGDFLRNAASRPGHGY